MTDNEVIVSVYCLAYNHQDYIRDALNGFINQKTDFRFEVIVHDDASTDNTAEVIREFEEKYPDIIKPIYQSENQYSKGVDIIKKFIKPMVRGKYVAICEGDDYWCDDDKLQKQVDFLESHSEYVACVHNTIQENLIRRKKILMYGDVEKDLELRELALNGSAEYHTSSILALADLVINRPDFSRRVNVGDYPMAINFSINGKIRYFPKPMSIYRYGTIGSWSRKNANLLNHIAHAKGVINMLNDADLYTNGKYHDIFEEAICGFQFSLDAWNGKKKKMFIPEYKKCWGKLSFAAKIMYFIGFFSPYVFELKWKFRG